MYGCLFTYSMFLCTTCTSALTTSLVGVAKSAITTIAGEYDNTFLNNTYNIQCPLYSGMYAFGGVVATKMMICGQTVNLLGAAFYAYEKYLLNVAKMKNSSEQDDSMLELGHDLKSDSDLIKYAADHEGSSRHESHRL